MQIVTYVDTVQVLDLLEEQLRRVDQRIDALLLVGGFSGSEYLFKRVEVRFPDNLSHVPLLHKNLFLNET